MKNWKTTVFGIVSALGMVLPFFGVSQPVAAAVQTIGVALLGAAAKDHNVSGTGA